MDLWTSPPVDYGTLTKEEFERIFNAYMVSNGGNPKYYWQLVMPEALVRPAKIR